MNRKQKLKLRNLILLLGSTLAVLTSVVLSPALPSILHSFQDQPNAEVLVKLVLTLPALFILIGAPIAGYLLDTWGRKPVLSISLLIFGIAGTAGYFLDSLTAILISRALLGLATAGTMSGFTTLIGDYFSDDSLNKFIGIQGAYMGLGGMVFSIIGGYLVDFSWRYVFLIHLIALILLPGVIFLIDEPIRKISNKLDLVQSANIKYPTNTVKGILLITIIGMAGIYMIPVYLPFYLLSISTISNAQVGQFLSIPTLTSLIIALNFQKIKSKISFPVLTAICFLVMGITYLVIGNSVTLPNIAIGMLIVGIGLGLFSPTLNIWVLSLTPESMRGRGIGGLTTAFFLGQFLTPIVIQPIVENTNLGETFKIVGLISLVIFTIFIVAQGIIKKQQSISL